MEPFQKTKRPVILHQKIMRNPNIKSIKDEKVVQSSYGAEKVSHSRRPKDHSFFIRKS